MFKNCCGCKNNKTNKKDVEDAEKDADSYVPKEVDAENTKSKCMDSKTKPPPEAVTIIPPVIITESDDVSVKSPLSDHKSEGDDAKKEEDETEAPSADTQSDHLGEKQEEAPVFAAGPELCVAEEEIGRRSRLPSEDEVDTETIQAVARGLLATPHPAKRGSGGIPNLASLPQWLSQEDDEVMEGGGTAEPPATPVGRDELALRRHRFFSDLLQAHQAGTEHRVRFDPLGPTVAGGE